jgi:hypothetical protein
MGITTQGWGGACITTFGWGGRIVEDREIVVDTDFRIATVLDKDMETGITIEHRFNLSTEMVFLLAVAIALDGDFDIGTELDTETEA